MIITAIIKFWKKKNQWTCQNETTDWCQRWSDISQRLPSVKASAKFSEKGIWVSSIFSFYITRSEQPCRTLHHALEIRLSAVVGAEGFVKGKLTRHTLTQTHTHTCTQILSRSHSNYQRTEKWKWQQFKVFWWESRTKGGALSRKANTLKRHLPELVVKSIII